MLGERESTLLFACCVTRRARFGLSLAAPLIGCASRCLLVLPGDADAACESARHPLSYYRYNLAYTRLHGLVAKASSKSHSAFLRPLGSRFTEVSVARH